MPPPREARAILFDWDGTLIDSFPAGFNASLAVARSFGIPFDRERFHATYSPNWYETYRRIGLAEEHWPRADELWRMRYSEQASPLYPFARTTVQSLRERGYLLGLVTSGDRDRVTAELARFELVALFSAVVCHEDTPLKKPHPEPLLSALERLGCPPGEAVFVGDRPEDVRMGRQAGTYTVGVESAYSTRGELQGAAPDLLLPDAGHLRFHFAS